MTLIRVKVKERGDWIERFVVVDDFLYEEALLEKKSTSNLDDYARRYNSGSLPKFNVLYNEIRKKLKNSMVDICLERINFVK